MLILVGAAGGRWLSLDLASIPLTRAEPAHAIPGAGRLRSGRPLPWLEWQRRQVSRHTATPEVTQLSAFFDIVYEVMPTCLE
jgi:hypothetical protein